MTDTYTSKAAIYKDFHIAVKFVLEEGRLLREEDYAPVRQALAKRYGANIKLFCRSVANLSTRYPTSVGFFVDVPVTGNTGQRIGTRYVLLQHEDGWEFFIRFTLEPNWLGPVIGSWLAGKLLDKIVGNRPNRALKGLLQFMREHWTRLAGNVRIDHVEIRTQNKGALCVPFSQFRGPQLDCLVRNFARVNHLSKCAGKCFGGAAVVVCPPESSG